MHHALVIAASTPTWWQTGVIAVGSAAIGGAIAGFAQWVLEGRRAANLLDLQREQASNDRDLADQRAEHERGLDVARMARERDQADKDDEAIARGAARLMREDLEHARQLCETSLHRGEWWPPNAVQPPRLAYEDRRALARYLPADRWEKAVLAAGVVETAKAAGEVGTRPNSTFEADATQLLELTILAISAAHEALAYLES
jgi:hypothetical protein